MKDCINCGEDVSNSEAFCDNCGESIENGEIPAEDVNETEENESEDTTETADAAEPAEESQSAPIAEPVTAAQPMTAPAAEPTPKKTLSTGLKLAIAGILGVIVLVSAAAAIFMSGTLASPVERFQEIQRMSIVDPLADAMTAAGDPEDFSTDIIITAGVESNDWMMAMVSSIMEQFALELSLDLNYDTWDSMLGLSFTAFNEEFISTAIVYTNDSIGLYIPTLDAYYVIDFDSLFGLLGDEFLAAFENQMAWTGEEYGDLIRRYADIVLAAVHTDNLEYASETLSLFDGRESVSATVYTFTPSEADLRNMLAALVQEVRDDEVIFALFTQQQNMDLLEWRGYGSVREYWDSYFADIDDAAIAEAAADLARGNFTWRTAVTGRQLLLQEISFTASGEDVVIRYEGYAGSGGTRTDWFTFEFDGGFFSLQNELTERNGDAVVGSMTGYFRDGWTRGPAERVFLITYDLDLGTESILGIPYGRYEMTGFDQGHSLFSFSFVVSAGSGGGSDHLLTVYGLEAFGFTSVTVNIHSTDEPSTIQRPTMSPVDLSGMSPAEIERTLEDLLWDLEDYLSLLLSAFDLF